jgi:hypothetical protein
MFAHAIIGINAFELFDANNLKSNVGQLVNQDVCVFGMCLPQCEQPHVCSKL